MLQRVDGGSMTHVGVELPMSTGLQMCYIKSVPRDRTAAPGDWQMHTMFYHVPTASTAQAAKTMVVCGKSPAVSLRSEFQDCLNDSAASTSATPAAAPGPGTE